MFKNNKKLNLSPQAKTLYEILRKENDWVDIDTIFKIAIKTNMFKGKTPRQSVISVLNSNTIGTLPTNKHYKKNKNIFYKNNEKKWKWVEEEISISLNQSSFDWNPNDDSKFLNEWNRKIEREISRLKTNRSLSNYVKKTFEDICQICKSKTFITSGKYMYFEIHHIVPLYKGGEDKEENLSKLCSNCHSEAHHASVEKQQQLPFYYKIQKKNGKYTQNEKNTKPLFERGFLL